MNTGNKMFVKKRSAYQQTGRFDARQKLQNKQRGAVLDARSRIQSKSKIVDARQKISLKKRNILQQPQQQRGTAKQQLKKVFSELEQQQIHVKEQTGQKSATLPAASRLQQLQQQQQRIARFSQQIPRNASTATRGLKPSMLSRLQPRVSGAGTSTGANAKGLTDMRQRIEQSRERQRQSATARPTQNSTFSERRRSEMNDSAVNKSGNITFHGGSIQKVISGHPSSVPAKVMPVRPALKRSALEMDKVGAPAFKVQRQLSPDHDATMPYSATVAPAVKEYVSPLAGHRVTVSNLESSVSQDDIIELFGAVGALRKVRVVKPGTAEVVFVAGDAAERAVKKYHLRELDGRPMSVVSQSKSDDAADTLTKHPGIKTHSHSVDDVTNYNQPLRSTSSSSVGNTVDLDVDVIHRALFKTSARTETTTRSHRVNFTVHV